MILSAIFRTLFPRKIVHKNNLKSYSKSNYNKSNSRNIIFNFGKYKGKKVKDVWLEDKEYCIWLINSSRYEGWRSSALHIYNELERLNNGNDILFFSFGKYKGESVNDILKSDRQYCEWLLNQSWAFDYKEVQYMSEMID
ncbi:exodeoxyribonuclease X C-terminal domain-containing protein [Riemerella anatipestifer]|nr:hypothetical protein [Riemerella anatipestifer]AFD55227.1 hypothetical protein RA0C_0218 [Riemerella anatipestifer ATCC 11845 = DSM 15868]UZX27502.1 hypothetical protein OIS45_09050 [Riemerella anatipestifer]